MFKDEFRRAALGALFLFAATAEPAFADNGPELWTQLETKVTVSEAPSLWPQGFRIIGVNVFGPRFPGIGQSLVRLSPLWELHPQVTLAFNFVSGVEQDKPGEFMQQLRAELEPTVRFDLWGVEFADRTRLERRWAIGGDRWRIRNQLKAAFPTLGWAWTPYVSNEIFYDFSDSAFNQNRAVAGFSKDLLKEVGLDAAYMLRSRLTDTGWQRDHLLYLGLSMDLKATPADPSP